ncbi:unnamed protein product [Triticum turgidum subsp. durum]|uniref:Uncharacterized protein n=1 Tax=Triticum turgidum subsp. durum TaxID=4567 RepID=A0A9R1RVS8_TRITD|nr:unnamed protein product [Triticum turgidum subsp. durum]
MAWVGDMKTKLEDAELPDKVQRWPKHCIFSVPPRFKMVDSSVYKPQTVSLGPFHHGSQDLKSMEEHKLRAVRHLLARDSYITSLEDLVRAVEEVADELEDSYMDLSGEWRGKENRGKFLEMMITDGCFLLEVMRTDATQKEDSLVKGYAHDPVFSWYGIQHIKPFVQRDMLLIENQLPLRLLQRIVAMEERNSPRQNTDSINSMVLKFLGQKDAQPRYELGLHPLDIYRTSQFRGIQEHINTASCLMIHHQHMMREETHRPQRPLARSARELTEAGIRLLPIETSRLNDFWFDRSDGTLQMPKIQVHDSTAYMFRNMMAFEVLRVGTTNDVTAYVMFLKDLVDTAYDVHLLVRNGVLEHDLANDNAVVRLFNGLTRDVTRNWENQLAYMKVREDVESYCTTHRRSNCVRLFLNESWAYLMTKYLRNPWTVLGLVTATLLLVADIVQAVYAVKSYKEGK